MKIKNRKSKGSQFEYSVLDSLKAGYPDIVLTKQLGFVRQYDLISEFGRIIVECKRHRGFSWNELKKYFIKLEERTSHEYRCYLIFQANHQPPLVMFRLNGLSIIVIEFDDKFCKFRKHEGVKKNVNKDLESKTINQED